MRPLIEAMAQRWPGVTIQPRLGDVRVLLLRGELDAMVMRGAEATESVVELVLREEPVVAAVPAGHAFAERTQIGLEVYVPTDGNPSRVVLLRRAQPPTGAVAALLEVAEDVLGEASVRPERPSPPPLG